MNLILFERLQNRYHLDRLDGRHRHIASVLRAVVGDTVRIGVVNGPVGTGTIVGTGKEGTTISAEWNESTLSPLPIDVLIGHPRPPVLQRLWRDLSTARVRGIHVFTGRLGERSYMDSSIWDNVETRLLEGASQGGHTVVPAVSRHRSIEDALRNLHAGEKGPGEYRLFGALGGISSTSLQEFLSAAAGHIERYPQSVAICVGPERGLTGDETSLLESFEYEGISLGTSIYRTETAIHGLVIPLAAVLCTVRDRYAP